jgi:hypothetical protein
MFIESVVILVVFLTDTGMDTALIQYLTEFLHARDEATMVDISGAHPAFRQLALDMDTLGWTASWKDTSPSPWLPNKLNSPLQ